MSGRIPEDVIADVRDRTDIVQVVGQFVQLKRAGNNFKGLCPFHQEKTPSFNVNAERQFYHCFGCQESGDVFSFVMKTEGRRFTEVVEDLAARAGVELPRLESPGEARAAAQRRSERQQSLELNAKTAELYRKLLAADSGSAAREYLKKRGIGNDITDTFQLGWAPPSGDVVGRLVKRERADEPFAEKLGLLGRRRNGGYYDRFWNRLIFPLLGARGEVLGFGGRRLASDPSGKAPKYVNTPETALYHKGEALYGLHAAAPAMRRAGCAILVEGNFDVLQLHQFGFDNALAPMGTALTDQQVRLIRRFCKGVVAVFDGDEAGRAAAQRSVSAMVDGKLEGKIATLPEGEDPDSFLLANGQEGFGALLDRAVPGIDYLIDDLHRKMEPTVPGRAGVLERIAPVVAKLESRVAKDLYADRLSMTLDIARQTVQRAIDGGRRSAEAVPRGGERPQEVGVSRPVKQKVDAIEIEPLGVLVEHPHLFPRAEKTDFSSLLTNEALRATYSAAAEMQRTTGQVEVARLLQATSPLVRDAVASIALSRKYASDGDPTRALDDCLAALQRRRVDRELKELHGRIEQAQSRGDAMALDRLREKLIELIEERRQIHETR